MESDEKTVVAIVALLLVEKKKKIRVGKTLAGDENLSLYSMRR